MKSTPEYPTEGLTRREFILTLLGAIGGFSLGSGLVFLLEDQPQQQNEELPGGIWVQAELSVSKGLSVMVNTAHGLHTEIERVEVNYKNPDGSWSPPFNLQHGKSDTFEGTLKIPELTPGQKVEVGFNVIDTRGTVSQSPAGTKILVAVL